MIMYERVKIKSTGSTGTIVDVNNYDGKVFYTVEDDATDEYDGLILHDCFEDDIEHIK